VLICYERKVLLADWWLVVGADLMWEKNTAGWLADKPKEQSVDWEWPNCWPCSIDRSLQYDVHILLFPRHRQLTYLHMIETLFYMNVLRWTRIKFGIISMSSFCVRTVVYRVLAFLSLATFWTGKTEELTRTKDKDHCGDQNISLNALCKPLNGKQWWQIAWKTKCHRSAGV